MNILFVDEPSVIQAYLPTLKAAPGFQVRVATTGAKALEHAAAFGIVDVLITDVSMKPMDGFQLRDLLLERCPLAKTVIITGFELDEYLSEIRDSVILYKPFDGPELLDAIQEAINAPAHQAPPEPVPVLEEEEELPPIQEEYEPEPEPEEVSRVGATLGGFQVVSLLGEGQLGPVYKAIQTAISRPVALKMLSARLQANEEARFDFLLDVSAKANVQHPNFIAVYEAEKDEEVDGHCFYAREFFDGETLGDLQERYEQLPQSAVVKVIRAVAMALAYLEKQRIHHKPLTARSIFLGADEWVRLANLATHKGSLPSPQSEIVALAAILSALLEDGCAEDPGLNGLLARMAKNNAQGFVSWSALLLELEKIENKLKASAPALLSAHNAAAINAIERVKKRKKRNLVFAVIGLFALLPVVGYKFYSNLNPGSGERNLSAQCKVPGGKFDYGKGEQINVGTFYIDKYEVTIGQYARFVNWIKEHPRQLQQYEHEKQPAGKSHIPPNWESLFDNAKWGMSAKAGEIGALKLNSPQFSVDFWDAYAYASWKGRRLPTEQEWEKAARGTDGRLYPWGNQWGPKKSNALSADAKPGKTRGCAPVDAYPEDVSPYGVVGMGGNVSEWTNSWEPSTSNPVVRGGSFASSDHELYLRTDNLPPGFRSESVGFRTCSSDEN